MPLIDGINKNTVALQKMHKGYVINIDNACFLIEH